MYNYLDFEKNVADLERQINELKKIEEASEDLHVQEEILRLKERSRVALASLYKKLTPWQKTQVARHPLRPHFIDYVAQLFTDVVPLAGDRKFGNDEAMQAGLARFEGQPIAFLGQEKGYDVETRVRHNFGSANPEGYRKAVRIMELANRFKLPLICLVDTAGAYPGVSAEERGQAEAIARSTAAMLDLTVPVVVVIVGEGGSGGAIAIAAGNFVYMLEHSIYSVISPEGAASILWRDSSRAQEAAANMCITAQDLFNLKVIDGIIPEPLGGAQREPQAAIAATGKVIGAALADMIGKDGDTLKRERHERFLQIGRNL